MQESIVFIHGFGEDSTIWDNIIPSFKDKYRLIIPDLPGIGTNATLSTDGITMESAADFIKSILDRENVDQCIMIGHSMGGYITLAFAEKYPQLLKKFGLFHSTAYADSDEKKEARKKNIAFINKNGTAKFVETSVPKLFSEHTAENQPHLIQELINRNIHLPANALANYTRAMMDRPDRIHILSSFKAPILFIIGEHDTAIPLEQSLKQCRIPEFSYIYIATHSGHLGMLEEPQFCVNAVNDFLSE